MDRDFDVYPERSSKRREKDFDRADINIAFGNLFLVRSRVKYCDRHGENSRNETAVSFTIGFYCRNITALCHEMVVAICIALTHARLSLSFLLTQFSVVRETAGATYLEKKSCVRGMKELVKKSQFLYFLDSLLI